MRNTTTHNLPLGQSQKLQDMNLTHGRKVGKKTRFEFMRVKISITVAFSGRIPVILGAATEPWLDGMLQNVSDARILIGGVGSQSVPVSTELISLTLLTPRPTPAMSMKVHALRTHSSVLTKCSTLFGHTLQQHHHILVDI